MKHHNYYFEISCSLKTILHCTGFGWCLVDADYSLIKGPEKKTYPEFKNFIPHDLIPQIFSI